MYKLFFATFFIAELIIAFAIINKLHKVDKSINALNETVCANKDKIHSYFVDIRKLLDTFNKEFVKFKGLIRQKRHEYLYAIVKTIVAYSGIFLLKGKYKKAVLAYQLATEIYESFIEV